MDKGLKIEFKDSNGNELALGDRVKVERKITLPNWDGWGRDLPEKGPTCYQKETHMGEIIYNPNTCRFMVKLDNTLEFDIFIFEKIEKI